MLIFISCRRWDLSKKELDVSSLHEKPGFQVLGALQGVRGDTCWAHYDTKLWLITDKMSITGNLSTCSPGIALRCNLPHPCCAPSACRFCGTVAESCSLGSRGIEMLSFTHPLFFSPGSVNPSWHVHQHNALFLPADANCGTYRQLLPLESNMLEGEGAEGVGPVLQHGDPCSRGRPQWKHSRAHQAAEMGARLSHHWYCRCKGWEGQVHKTSQCCPTGCELSPALAGSIVCYSAVAHNTDINQLTQQIKWGKQILQ